ncbi:MAG: 30S ribosomal protein S2 [Candidatus Pacebacteria bacterium]|nr:30S ribosomal protein S2 [Candidatus Paceibacterota bacterium]
MANIPSLEQMLKAGMHFGHRTSRWHPKMEPFIFTQRNGLYIINLEKSQEQLQTALDFITNLAKENKNILFVGTKKQVQKPMKEMAQATSMPYVVGKWLGGCLTNFPVIKKSIKKYLDLKEGQASGKFEKYTKKEKLNFEREIEKMEGKLGGLSNLTKLPDALFIWDIKEEKTAVTEARKKNIPVIGICDTNVNPEEVNYPIASNDDSTKTINLILDTIKDFILEAKKEIKK